LRLFVGYEEKAKRPWLVEKVPSIVVEAAFVVELEAR
jgi:hypothetical protein